MADKKAAIELIKKYILLCGRKNIRFNKVILFGSVIKGTATENSDIDVVFVSDQFTDNTFENWKMLAPVSASIYDIEPHPYPTGHFLKGDPFIDEVKKSGVEIPLS